MQLTLCGESALRQLRAFRCAGATAQLMRARCDLRDPNPSPRKRWTWNLMKTLDFPAQLGRAAHAFDTGESNTTCGRAPNPAIALNVAVSRKAHRLELRGCKNTIYAVGMPRGAFTQVGHGLAMSSPELLFVELARELPLPELMMVGLELCGGFSLNADMRDSRHVTMDVPPVTSVAKLKAFTLSASRIRGAGNARRALKFVMDDAWSPMEAVVATMLAMPIEKGGYGLGPCDLNRRFDTPQSLLVASARSSRVPDILIPRAGVGFNYDGENHLDLNSIVAAVREVDAHPESASASLDLQSRLAKVRGKAVDDLRRNRELAALGLTISPLVKEDLFRPRGLDAVVAQAMSAIEVHTGRRLIAQRKALVDETAVARRDEVLRSLISCV